MIGSEANKRRLVEESRKALLEVNDRFWRRGLLGPAFYAQLGEHGFDCARSLLVVAVPEGSNTYSGNIIRQDGRVFEFDVDLDLPHLSQWEDITQSFLNKCRRLEPVEPWADPVVALALFGEIHRQN